MCILLGVFEACSSWNFFKNLQFRPFYSDFKIKKSEIMCKNIIFVNWFKTDFKNTK